MQLTSLQRQSLNLMGIPLWEYRDSHLGKAETEQSVTDAGSDIDFSKPYLVLVDKIELTQDENRLLSAILKAIHVDYSSVALIDIKHLETVQEQSQAYQHIIIFDANFNETQQAELLSSAQMTMTYALSTLLQQASLKKHAWQVLRTLIT